MSTRQRHALHWELARHDRAQGNPAEWVSAEVPGAVQLDWARAKGWPEFWRGDHVLREWADLDESWWTYRTTVAEPPAIEADEQLVLVLEGVDYACDVFADGERLGGHEGLQQRVEINVGGRLRRGSVIAVRFRPAPKSHSRTKDRTQANRSGKPAVAYGWDFHPRLIPLGLWRPAYLETRSRLHFAGLPLLDYRLSDDFTQVAGKLRVALSLPAGAGCLLRWRLFSPEGVAVQVEQIAICPGEHQLDVPFAFDEVALWWPHDQGESALYRSTVELVSGDGATLDEHTATVGFRRARLVMAPGQWSEPTGFPKSRSRPPMTLEVNGRALFVKGSNWVCPDVFPGALTRERFTEQLALVRSSNLSLLRLWGGAAAPQDDFYELCDEFGIMVWQEFPLACNDYPDDDAYLATLDRESRALLERLRGHASVVLWCGGNELFNRWSGMTDQSLALRLLNRNCFDLDPTRPFLPTMPIEGVGHGHYVFRDSDSGVEAWELFQRARCTAYTEFGCTAPPSVAALKRVLPVNEQWPPRPGTSWETHHAFGAWLASSHLYLEQIEFYFGPSASLDELVERAQALQAICYQGLFEEARRQKPVASMALNWCFNEPWPCAANNSLVAWPCEPKPALEAVRAACRPTLASARIAKMAWAAGEVLEIELWLLHDAPTETDAAEVVATIELDGRKTKLGVWKASTLAANTNQRGPRLTFALPEFAGPRFFVRLECARGEWSSSYTLLKARTAP